jgi:pimeloyl-ACP methyl ester carboxylesterase
MYVSSDNAKIYFETAGNGFPVVLLHPFPVHHGFWNAIAPTLSSQYRLVLPDLRAHGSSEAGTGTASMRKHARDLLHLLDALKIQKAIFVGVSIGGYILFEFWRQFRERVAALALANTRAEADTEQGRANRLKSIADARVHGTSSFFDAQINNLIGATTRTNRPDLVTGGRAMMTMNVDRLAATQQGLAERPDSVATLRTINVKTLIVAGEEDTMTPVAHAQLINAQIPGSKLAVIPRAGHYAAWEQPEEFLRVLKPFLENVRSSS